MFNKKKNVLWLIFAYITVCIFTPGCNIKQDPDEVQNSVYLKLSPSNLPSPSKLSEIIESVRLIPLETDTDCLIEAVNRIFVGEHNIIVSTMYSQQEILRFNDDGTFLNKIGSRGKGRGEYINIRSISVFEEEGIIYVSSSDGRIISYDLEGNFIDSYDNIEGYSAAIMIDKNISAHAGMVDYGIKIKNWDSNQIQNLLPISQEAGVWYPQYSGSNHSGVFYSAIGHDTVWRIMTDTIFPAIIFDFGSGSMSSEEYLSLISSGKPFPPGKLSLWNGVFYGSGYYMTGLLREDTESGYNYYNLIMSSERNEVWHFAPDKRSDDIFFSSSSTFSGTSVTGEWVSVISSDKMVNAVPQIEKNVDFKYDPGIIEQIKSISIEDNPVIILFEFK